MKTINTKIDVRIFKYLLFLPILLFTFCQDNDEVLYYTVKETITKDANVISLMRAAVQSNSDQKFTKSFDNDQCTEFQYPMTFYVFRGDDPAIVTVINNDEELIAFIDSLTTSNELYLIFPITLIDVDGGETVVNNLAELEGTLQLIVDACSNGDDDNDNDDNGNDDYEYCHSNNKKVNICHKGQTICVSINAIWGHLNQHDEDYLGSCTD